MDRMLARSKGFVFLPVLLGVVVTVVAAVVLVLGVQRVKDLQTVLQRPKAAETYCSPGSQPSCCNQIASGGGFDSCGWTDRGKCTLDQCAGSDSQPLPNCAYNSSTGQPQGPKNCNCGLFYRTYCAQATCRTGKASNPNPTNGQINVSATAPLSWGYSETPSGGTVYASVYVWSCAAKDNGCLVFSGGASNPNGSQDSVVVPGLLPNKQYWWVVTPGITGCGVQLYADTWTFTTGAGTPPPSTVPNCTNLTGPASLTVGQAGTYTASHSSPQGNLGGTIDVGQNGQFLASSWPPVGSGTSSLTWTPTAAGTYDILCRSWNDGVAECRGKANYVDAPPRYTCAGPNSSLTVTVTAGTTCSAGQTSCNGTCVDLQTNNSNCGACGAVCPSGKTCTSGVCTASTVECTTDSQCSDDKKCNLTTNKCVVPTCSPEPGVCQTAQYKNHACSLANKADGTVCETNKVCSNGACVASEANACWDNKGVNGKCYDCNGDGTINILDFSCFQKHWLENVQ